MINIGELNQRVEFNQHVKSKQSDGGFITVKSKYKTVWAKVEDMSTFEKSVIGRKEGARLIKLTVRYRADITNDMGFTWNGEYYNIIAPLENIGQRNFFMTIKGELEWANR